MAQLITDYDGLLALKRALSRFNLIIRESIEDQTHIIQMVNSLLSGTSSLSKLIRVAYRYDVVLKSLKDCKPLCPLVDFRNGCDCDDGTVSQQRNCNKCEGGPFASELFGAIDSITANQNLLISLSDELARLVRAIAAYYNNKCDRLPCENKLEELISRLICCNCKPVFDDCQEFDHNYPIALVIFIALLFNGAYPRVKCLLCNVKNNKGCECKNRNDNKKTENIDNINNDDLQSSDDHRHHDHHQSNDRHQLDDRRNYDRKSECPCEGNNCKCLDPCTPCITSLYELSLGGLHVLFTIGGQDNFNKYFSIIGLDLFGIVRRC